ncbi:MAG: DUF5685 family protein [Clostridiales bacterium]|nr:DUF5685 family protein [Clostridiales bacterium]
MFGYVLPLREELKVKDWERYRAVYCGLCHTMGRQCGQLSRLLLSYDFTFLALLLGAGGDQHKCRCVAAPCRGRSCCATSAALELAADECMILTWWKFQDQIQDESFWKGLGARLLAQLYRRAYRRAACRRPDFDRLVSRQLDALHRLEAERCPSLDRPADAFAKILAGAIPPTGDTARDRATQQLLYHVGRWIYLTDAWDDLEEDLAQGSYNPILLRYGLDKAPAPEGPEGQQLRMTLTHSVNLALSALQLLEETENTPLLENILWGGLPLVQRLVLSGKWKQQKRLLREKQRQ